MGLWTAVDSKKEKMHTAIMQLVQLCTKLRELDHCDFYEKRFAWRRIAIIREGEFGESVRYEVRKPLLPHPISTTMIEICIV